MRQPKEKMRAREDLFQRDGKNAVVRKKAEMNTCTGRVRSPDRGGEEGGGPRKNKVNNIQRSAKRLVRGCEKFLLAVA